MTKNNSERIRIGLVEDHRIVREGLRQLLETQNDMIVVGEAANGHEGIRLVEEMRPDVVIMDVAMPELNGIEATREIASRFPETRVVALSIHSDRQYIVEMMRAGATGYLLKSSAFDDVATAVRTVRNDQVYLSPDVVALGVEDLTQMAGADDQKSGIDQLTTRERQVLQLLAEGHSIRVTSEKLTVSGKTVESHRSNIMSKLGIRNIAELTKWAIRHGITSLTP